MLTRILGKLMGVDTDRDKETFFLSMMLDLGAPVPVYAFSKKVADIEEQEMGYLLRFATRAKEYNMQCDKPGELKQLYAEYTQWYESSAEANPF
jgi:hypothetical protein